MTIIGHHAVDSSIKVAIFDMDGLLFDTERVARWAWAIALGKYGFHLTDAIYDEFVGRDMAWRQTVLMKHFGPGLPLPEIMEERIGIGDAREAAEGLPPKPGVNEILDECKAHGLRIGLATGTTRERTLRRLKQSDIARYFDAIVTSADVSRGKPAPDIYIKTLDRLAKNAGEAIAFEDSPAGVVSAADAGIRTIMVPDMEAPTVEASRRAFRVYTSLLGVLNDLDVLLVRSCFKPV